MKSEIAFVPCTYSRHIPIRDIWKVFVHKQKWVKQRRVFMIKKLTYYEKMLPKNILLERHIRCRIVGSKKIGKIWSGKLEKCNKKRNEKVAKKFWIFKKFCESKLSFFEFRFLKFLTKFPRS